MSKNLFTNVAQSRIAQNILHFDSENGSKIQMISQFFYKIIKARKLSLRNGRFFERNDTKPLLYIDPVQPWIPTYFKIGVLLNKMVSFGTKGPRSLSFCNHFSSPFRFHRVALDESHGGYFVKKK